ncbi:MAG TPA: MarR family winged helix-turn-helix transcriptional regulator [Allosphingosinicella sp.]|jgi:DNA-binding MarR family transcriptional regulator
MTSLPIQRRLDSLARDVEAMRETLASVASRVDAPGPPAPGAAAQALLGARRHRGEMLGAQLFADPAWDMLLALFVAAEQGESFSVSRLCAAAAVPQTTALRWLEQLEQNKLVIRAADATDARRTLISIAPDAREKMRILLRRTVSALTGAPDAPNGRQASTHRSRNGA